MLITENEIRKLIRQSLFEAKEKNRESYEAMLETSKEKVKSEIDAIDFISDSGKTKLTNLIDKIKIIIIKEEKGGVKRTKAYALYVKIDDSGDPKSDQFTEGSEFLDAESEGYYNSWKADSLPNPRIVINQSLFSLKGKQETIDHETRHIKNTAIKFLLGTNKLNADEVKNILRDDFRKKNEDQIIDIWMKEGRFPADNPTERSNAKSLLSAMFDDYNGVFEGNQKSVDEFAVRAAALKTKPMAMANNKGMTVIQIKEKYGEDISQIIPFLKDNLKWDDFKKITSKDKKRMQTLPA